MGWWDSIFGPSTGYQAMPDAASVTDVRGLGPSNWASRPHDQNLQSRNMGGYYDNSIQMGGPAYQWQKAHGLGGDLPLTPLPDPDTIPSDPRLVAHIRDAQARRQAAQAADEWATNPRRTNLPPGQARHPSRPNEIMGTTLNFNPWGYR